MLRVWLELIKLRNWRVRTTLCCSLLVRPIFLQITDYLLRRNALDVQYNVQLHIILGLLLGNAFMACIPRLLNIIIIAAWMILIWILSCRRRPLRAQRGAHIQNHGLITAVIASLYRFHGSSGSSESRAHHWPCNLLLQSVDLYWLGRSRSGMSSLIIISICNCAYPSFFHLIRNVWRGPNWWQPDLICHNFWNRLLWWDAHGVRELWPSIL